jgi:uncharacterized protein
MKLEGVITNVTAFGAFVDVGVHQDGLVHVSELADKFVKDPHEVVKAGDVVSVRVKEIDVDRKRIGLSMKREVPGAQSAQGAQTKSGGDKGKQAPRGNQPMSAGRVETRPEDSPFAALAKLKKQ